MTNADSVHHVKEFQSYSKYCLDFGHDKLLTNLCL